MLNKPVTKTLVILALFLSAFFAEKFVGDTQNNIDKTDGFSQLETLISKRQSGQMVSFEAIVVKLLKDDLKGDKHQKLILKTGNNTVLLAHNIDIAPRVPVKKGDTLLIKGQYEWNEKGGLVHWTHRSNNNHPNGWIKYNNKKYQ